jgi:hypothetical protein
VERGSGLASIEGFYSRRRDAEQVPRPRPTQAGMAAFCFVCQKAPGQLPIFLRSWASASGDDGDEANCDITTMQKVMLRFLATAVATTTATGN